MDILVVPDDVPEIPMIIGQPFTEQRHIILYKDNKSLRFLKKSDDYLPQIEGSTATKTKLWAKDATVIPPSHIRHVVCRMEAQGDVFVDLSVRSKEGQEHCVPRCIVSPEDEECIIPVMNLADQGLINKKDRVVARGSLCIPDPMTSADASNNCGTIPDQRKRLLEL